MQTSSSEDTEIGSTSAISLSDASSAAARDLYIDGVGELRKEELGEGGQEEEEEEEEEEAEDEAEGEGEEPETGLKMWRMQGSVTG